MRIISQSGMIDLPYEQVEVCITSTCPNKVVAFSDNGQRELAEYSTPEKAKKAMEMLRDYYVSRWMLQMSDNEARVALLEEVSIEVFAKQAVFRFPQEKEIEVLGEG